MGGMNQGGNFSFNQQASNGRNQSSNYQAYHQEDISVDDSLEEQNQTYESQNQEYAQTEEDDQAEKERLEIVAKLKKAVIDSFPENNYSTYIKEIPRNRQKQE